MKLNDEELSKSILHEEGHDFVSDQPDEDRADNDDHDDVEVVDQAEKVYAFADDDSDNRRDDGRDEDYDDEPDAADVDDDSHEDEHQDERDDYEGERQNDFGDEHEYKNDDSYDDYLGDEVDAEEADDVQLDEMLRDLHEDEQDAQAEMNALAHKKLREKRLKKLKRKRKFWRVAAVALTLFVICGGLIAFDYLSSWGTIHRNVNVSGIDLSGKTADEAKIYLEERLTQLAENSLSIQYEPELSVDEDAADIDNGDSDNGDEDVDARRDFAWEMYAADIDLSFDTTEAVQLAFDFGRSDDIWQSFVDRLMSYFEEYHIDISVDADAERVEGVFSEIREITDVGFVDSRVVLDDDSFVIETGSDGIALDETELIARMANAILTQDYEIEAPIGTAYRYIDDANAQRAADRANEAASLPVDVSYNDQVWTFEASDIVQVIEFVRSDNVEEDDAVLQAAESDLVGAAEDDADDAANAATEDDADYYEDQEEHALEVVISTDEVRERIVGRLGTDVGSAPVNARFVVRGANVSIQPSVTGSGVDAAHLANDLAVVLTDMNEDNRSVEVTMRDIEPRRTTADAEDMGIRERISTYTTNFSLGNANRLNNIQLISRMLDGIIVAPGEEFSFNGATGRRDTDDGFLAAGVIIGGEMSTAVGGGICQVSTTMFNTAMLAGVQITQRINHSTFVSSYSPGRDAAVARYGPDFRFRNTLDNYILISATTTNSTSTISFFSIDPGYDITIRAGNFSRTNFQTEEVRDNTLPRGEREVERPGIRGGTVNVYYTVRDGDRIVRQQTFTSNYRNVNEIVRVGTMRERDSDD